VTKTSGGVSVGVNGIEGESGTGDGRAGSWLTSTGARTMSTPARSMLRLLWVSLCSGPSRLESRMGVAGTEDERCGGAAT